MNKETLSIAESISAEIIPRIDNSWTKRQKIRFVYLELGKYLEKNTDFFLNDKLDDFALSKEEMMNIYSNDIVNTSNRENYRYQYQVICKSAAFFLKYIFDKIGIKSEYVRTTGKSDGIRHWFIAAQDDTGSNLFLTLAADLPFIKNNFPTEHFATDFSYMRDGIQLYEAPEEIDHLVLSKEELKSLDESIGYSKLYSLDEKGRTIDLFPKNYSYIHFTTVEENSEIFNIFKRCLKIDDSLIKRIDEIENSDFIDFLQELNKYVCNSIVKSLNIDGTNVLGKDIEGSLKNIIVELGKKRNINIDGNLSIKQIMKSIKKTDLFRGYEQNIELINILLRVNNLINNFVSIREQYEKLQKEISELENNKLDESNADIFKSLLYEESILKNKLEDAQKEIGISKLNELLKRISYYFVSEDLEYNSSAISTTYVAKKLAVMFPIVFESYRPQDPDRTPNSFSLQGYSEQIVIIKKLLRIVFNEITQKNTSKISNYNSHYSPVENIIQTYPLRDKKTGEYCIGFYISGLDDEKEYSFIYIPSINVFKSFDLLMESENYLIVSNRFTNKIDELENDSITR